MRRGISLFSTSTRSRKAAFRASCALGLMLTAFATSCGQDEPTAQQKRNDLGMRTHGTKAADRVIPKGESRIRTIVGEVLEKRDDAVGDWARKRKTQQQEKRRTQRWLQPIDYDFGEQRVGTKLKAELTLQNPTDKTQKITGFSKSCTCQSVVLVMDGKRRDMTKGVAEPIVLEPGKKGILEVGVEVPNRQGRMSVSVRVETSDTEFVTLDAQLHVIAVRDLQVYVGEDMRDAVDFGILTKASKRDFEFRVVSRDGKPFDIKKHRKPIPPGMTLRYEKLTANGGEWVVRGTLGPDLPAHSAGGAVTFDTNRGTFEIKVFAAVQPPIKVTPDGLVAFGVVQRTKGAEKVVEFEAIDPEDAFRIEKIKFFDVPEGLIAGGKDFTAVVEHDKGGRKAKVRVRVPDGIRRGRFHVGMQVHFTDKRFEPRKIRLLGHAR